MLIATRVLRVMPGIEPPVRGRASGVKNLYLEEDAVVLEYGLGQECAKLVGVFGREGRVSVL